MKDISVCSILCLHRSYILMLLPTTKPQLLSLSSWMVSASTDGRQEYVLTKESKTWTLPDACSQCEELDVGASLLAKASTTKAVTCNYYEVLHSMEEDGLVDLSDEMHLFCVHYVILPRLSSDLKCFLSGWNKQQHWDATNTCG
ncbi:hypothetical protein N1851_031491 [Merluccius polli]|uniref:Integrase core domain-containing protein n=1 Tax=Merluccius polli TaxID=89951 RepID=A0AA47M3U7_MERPO|nr:hypothetical protein N1851_031491 [Merluccius polli]